MATALRGIVFMATPFLHVETRRLERTVEVNTAVLACALGTLGVAAAGYHFDWNNWVIWPSALVVGFGLGVAWIAVLQFWAVAALRTYEEVKLPRVSTDMLVVRSPGDEASAALGFVQFASWMATKIYLLSARVLSRASTALQRLVVFGLSIALVFTALAVPVGFLAHASGHAALTAVGWMLGVLFFILLLLSMLFGGLGVLGGALLVPIFAVMAVLSRSSGPELVLHALFLEVNIEGVPPGVSTAWNIQPEARVHERRRLLHSMVYDDPEAIDVVVRWIRDRVAERRA